MAKVAQAVLTLVAVLAAAILVTTPAAAQKAPADFTLEKAKDSPGTVTFSHDKHKAGGVDKCNACHPKAFKMKKNTTGVSMEKIKAGEQCGACHDGKTEIGGKKVFAADDKANCEKCHKK